MIMFMQHEWMSNDVPNGKIITECDPDGKLSVHVIKGISSTRGLSMKTNQMFCCAES